MAQSARKLQGAKRIAHLLFYITIKKAKASQKPATSRGISKKRSETRKTKSRQERKKYKEMAKHHKPKHPKGRRSGRPREARKKQRTRQRKRVRFATAKRPLPPFFLFMAQHRPGLQKSNPYWTAVETVKKLGKMWHKQPEKDKETYKEQAAQLRRKKQKRKARVGAWARNSQKRSSRQKKIQAERRKWRLWWSALLIRLWPSAISSRHLYNYCSSLWSS